MLNAVLQVAPFTDAVLADVRALDSKEMAARIKSGKAKHCASVPASRGFGPLLPIYGLDGLVVGENDNMHPFRA